MTSIIRKELDGQGLAMTHSARLAKRRAWSDLFMLFTRFASIIFPTPDLAKNVLLVERQPPR